MTHKWFWVYSQIDVHTIFINLKNEHKAIQENYVIIINKSTGFNFPQIDCETHFMCQQWITNVTEI